MNSKTETLPVSHNKPANSKKNHPKTLVVHECDFYHDREAGDLMKAGLKLGASKPWQDILEAMTGSRTISAEPFREYFAPLEKWLDAEIEEKSIPVGW